MAGGEVSACGPFSSRVSGKSKKLPSLHYTAAQLWEKGVLLEIQDLPPSQCVTLLQGRSPCLGLLSTGPGVGLNALNDPYGSLLSGYSTIL